MPLCEMENVTQIERIASIASPIRVAFPDVGGGARGEVEAANSRQSLPPGGAADLNGAS